MMAKGVKIGYSTHGVIICHGKSEYLLFTILKRRLKLRVEIDGDKHGGKSVQIRSIPNYLRRQDFKSVSAFTSKNALGQYASVRQKKLASDFKIFFVMDLDDCSEEDAAAFVDCSMFLTHWAYPHIVPIFCKPNIEAVFEELGHHPKSRNKVDYYNKLFLEILTDRSSIAGFCQALSKCRSTNLSVLVDFLLRHS